MFGIGGIEFLIIAIIAIVVIGPAELPRVLYALGKGMRKVREVSKTITDSFDDVTREVELQDIISKANVPGGEDIDFMTEQQLALERRRMEGDRKKQPPKKTAATKKNRAAAKKSAAAKARKTPVKKTTKSGKSTTPKKTKDKGRKT